VIYKGQPTGLYYRADFFCFGEIIIELKAVRSLGPVDEAQAINYLKVSKLKRALLINFGAKSLEWRRLVL
jgi:GxxExxY protein